MKIITTTPRREKPLRESYDQTEGKQARMGGLTTWGERAREGAYKGIDTEWKPCLGGQ